MVIPYGQRPFSAGRCLFNEVGEASADRPRTLQLGTRITRRELPETPSSSIATRCYRSDRDAMDVGAWRMALGRRGHSAQLLNYTVSMSVRKLHSSTLMIISPLGSRCCPSLRRPARTATPEGRRPPGGAPARRAVGAVAPRHRARRVDKPKSRLPRFRRGSCLKTAAALPPPYCKEGWPRVAMPFREQSRPLALKPIPD